MMDLNGQENTPWTPPPTPAARVHAALERLAHRQDWGSVPVALIAQATGYSERHVRRLLRQMDIGRTLGGHWADIGRTRLDTFGHETDTFGHETDTKRTRNGHAASLFPTGPGDETCSLVLSLPYSSPVPDLFSFLDPKDPPLPPSGVTPPTTKKATRLPEDPENWALFKTALCTPSILKLGANVGFTLDDVQEICEDMKDWSLGKGETRKDWPATLRTFIRRAARHPRLRPGQRVLRAEEAKQASKKAAFEALDRMGQEGKS